MITDYSIVNLILFVLGLYILGKSSDLFVDCASYIARKFKISEIVIGLTLVSIGTSLPEIATNVYSSIMGKDAVALGNVIGSNITNILLAFGAVLLLRDFAVSKKIFYRDGLVLFIMTALFAAFAYVPGEAGKLIISRWQGSLLMFGAIAYIWYLVKHANEVTIEEDHHGENINSTWKAVILLIASIFTILLGAKMMIDNAVWFATKFNIPPSVISATIIAIGTSLPEIAVSVSGVKKSKPEIVIGNVIGSCIFNISLALGSCAAVKAVTVGADTEKFLLPFLILTTAICLLFMRMKWKLVKWHGVTFCLLYLIFIIINVLKVIK